MSTLSSVSITDPSIYVNQLRPIIYEIEKCEDRADNVSRKIRFLERDIRYYNRSIILKDRALWTVLSTTSAIFAATSPYQAWNDYNNSSYLNCLKNSCGTLLWTITTCVATKTLLYLFKSKESLEAKLKNLLKEKQEIKLLKDDIIKAAESVQNYVKALKQKLEIENVEHLRPSTFDPVVQKACDFLTQQQNIPIETLLSHKKLTSYQQTPSTF